MNFKIDTKEKFHEIKLLETNLSANMTDTLSELLLQFQKTAVKNVIVSLEMVADAAIEAAKKMAGIQQGFYENGHSFVIYGLQPSVIKMLEANDLLDEMNITPTQSEAWDILQMEELERELMNDF